ncbi:MAG TPA: phosphotransferase [Acidobacteriota bacterium]|nr:phosphotransferase [Acidobacteriota bacterium]
MGTILTVKVVPSAARAVLSGVRLLPDKTIQAALKACLGEASFKIRERGPLTKASSFPIEKLEIESPSRGRIQLVCKHLSVDAMLEGAAAAKPRFALDPLREAAVYLDLLAPLQDELGTARLLGFENGLLFIECVQGAELYERGLESWKAAAQWLRRFHGCSLHHSPNLDSRLLHFDAAWFGKWADRAGRFLTMAKDGREQVQAFESARDEFLERVEDIESYPQGVIHGEFYASNVLAEETSAGLRIVPIDWEMCGVGPQWLDLAALTSGPWTPEDITQIEDAYGLDDRDRPKAAFLRRALALQWLGWSADWIPPEGQRQNWLDAFLSDR